MKFKLPQLHLLVDANKKSSEEDPKKYVHVINGHAIVNNNLICAVSLREYVKLECDVTDELELDRLTGILDWMEGKSFTKEFWAELVKECFVNLNGEDQLEIEHQTYNKLLVYEYVACDKELPLQVISDNICRDESNVNRVGIDGSVLTNLTKVFKNEIKNDSIVFGFTGSANAVKFTCSRRDYIFGLIPVNYDSASELTAFLGNSDFKDGIDKYLSEIKES